VVFILFSTLIYAKPQSTGNVKIVNNELYVNGKSFIIKGITYQPTPIGEDVRYGYNLSNHPELWHRDFPLLREMNANTIRTWAKVTNSDFLDDAYNNGSKPIYVLMGYWMNVYVDNYSNPTTRSYYINDFRNYVILLFLCGQLEMRTICIIAEIFLIGIHWQMKWHRPHTTKKAVLIIL